MQDKWKRLTGIGGFLTLLAVIGLTTMQCSGGSSGQGTPSTPPSGEDPQDATPASGADDN